MYLREVVMHCRGTLALQLGVRAHSECVAIKALTEGHFGKPTSEIAAYALPISPLPIYTIDRILWYVTHQLFPCITHYYQGMPTMRSGLSTAVIPQRECATAV